MYSVAVQKRDLETEAKRYVNWLRNLVKADDGDKDFCDKLEMKLDLISVCHGELYLILLISNINLCSSSISYTR